MNSILESLAMGRLAVEQEPDENCVSMHHPSMMVFSSVGQVSKLSLGITWISLYEPLVVSLLVIP